MTDGGSDTPVEEDRSAKRKSMPVPPVLPPTPRRQRDSSVTVLGWVGTGLAVVAVVWGLAWLGSLYLPDPPRSSSDLVRGFAIAMEYGFGIGIVREAGIALDLVVAQLMLLLVSIAILAPAAAAVALSRRQAGLMVGAGAILTGSALTYLLTFLLTGSFGIFGLVSTQGWVYAFMALASGLLLFVSGQLQRTQER